MRGKSEPKTIALNPTCAGTSFQGSFLKRAGQTFHKQSDFKGGPASHASLLNFSPDHHGPLSLGLVYKILTHITTQLSELMDQEESSHHRVLPLSGSDIGHCKRIGMPGNWAPRDLVPSSPNTPKALWLNSPGRRRPGARERGNFLTSLDVLAFTHKILSHDWSGIASGSG